MDPIKYFPQEISRQILIQIELSTLLTAKTVNKAWLSFMHLINLDLVNVNNKILDGSFLEKHSILSIDQTVIEKIKKFFLEIKGQSGVFTIKFLFNPESKIELSSVRQIKTGIVKKETLIFLKKIPKEKDPTVGDTLGEVVDLHYTLPFKYFSAILQQIKSLEKMQTGFDEGKSRKHRFKRITNN